MTDTNELTERLTRPIIGIENRTAQEVFDIMADRFRHAFAALTPTAGEAPAHPPSDPGTPAADHHPAAGTSSTARELLEREKGRYLTDPPRTMTPEEAALRAIEAALNRSTPPQGEETSLERAAVIEWLKTRTTMVAFEDAIAAIERGEHRALSTPSSLPIAPEKDVGPCEHCRGTGSADVSGQLGMSSDDSKCWWCRGTGRKLVAAPIAPEGYVLLDALGGALDPNYRIPRA